MTETDDHANALPYISEMIETAVNNTVQANGSQLSRDLAAVTRAAQIALKRAHTRQKWFKTATTAAVIVVSYYVMALTSRRVYFFPGIQYAAIGAIVVWSIAFLFKPASSDVSRLTGFVNRTARTGQAKVEEYFRQLTADDQE
jgi:hypothetical protein